MLFEDSGFPRNSRYRIIHVMVHKRKASVVGDVNKVYEAIADELKKKGLMPMSALFWENDAKDLRQEMLQSGNTSARGSQGHTCPVDDWLPLLTSKEKATCSSIACVLVYYIYICYQRVEPILQTCS